MSNATQRSVLSSIIASNWLKYLCRIFCQEGILWISEFHERHNIVFSDRLWSTAIISANSCNYQKLWSLRVNEINVIWIFKIRNVLSTELSCRQSIHFVASGRLFFAEGAPFYCHKSHFVIVSFSLTLHQLGRWGAVNPAKGQYNQEDH